MTSVFERKDRRVLPNWRRFEFTANLGELNNWKAGKQNQFSHKLSIKDYLLSWENNKNIPFAGDLLACSCHFSSLSLASSSMKMLVSILMAMRPKMPLRQVKKINASKK